MGPMTIAASLIIALALLVTACGGRTPAPSHSSSAEATANVIIRNSQATANAIVSRAKGTADAMSMQKVTGQQATAAEHREP